MRIMLFFTVEDVAICDMIEIASLQTHEMKVENYLLKIISVQSAASLSSTGKSHKAEVSG